MVKYRGRIKYLLILIKHYFNHYFMESIQRKLISTLLIIILVPLITFLMISTNIARGTVESSEISSNISRVDLSGDYIEYQLQEYDELLFSSMVDDMLVPYLTEPIQPSNVYTIQSFIQDKLLNLYNSRSSIQAASLISFENKMSYRLQDNDFFVNPYLYAPDNPGRKDVLFNMNDSADSFTLERNIFRFEDQKLIGRIKVDIHFSLFDPIMKNLQSNKGEHVLLISTTGQILYNPSYTSIGNLAKKTSKNLMNGEIQAETTYHQEDDVYVFQKKLNKNIILIKLVPNEVMNIGATHIRQSGTMIIFISILLTILLSIFVAGEVTKPIIQLSKTMENVEENNFKVKINTYRLDEIGILNRKFQEMLARIRELIEKDFKREMEKKDAQFLALQAQINPHFLYNTLQVIGGMAIKKDAKEIDDVSQRLSRMFRYITKSQNSIVQIHEEVNHLNNYLYIQQIRFHDKVNIQLFVDEDAKNGFIPLLTIQPLIENCFIHGFDSKLDDWVIKVDIQKVFDEVEIVIEDNGLGISPENLLAIQRNLSSGKYVQKGRIGLQNVNARIKLFFGDEYGIDIQSEQSKFTRIILRLPYQTTKGA
ncbi:sensor histidine kinase [Lederbergia galactosidilytica]|uniref:HAMP domain-containing protein n=1 Tax=Lederbergia galactosidilytica TaxID=217031 RepID=A0A177ZKJ2_9BACI|nr:histidine kinase [Lederbergia galactosidilytica]OAK68511.1 hypothetical protein ABB05_15665 [Lederbergia galactosidilytica]